MKKDWILTREAFDQLLAWFDSNRDRAGEKYEHIRGTLIEIFTCRGCAAPEDLADETINRVTTKLPELVDGYVGDPALYFFGVAKRVYLDAVASKPALRPRPESGVGEDAEREHACLERCVSRLKPESQELILQYYRHDKRAKIDYRRDLASRLGVPLNALRIRVHRIRAGLQECVSSCLKQRPTG